MQLLVLQYVITHSQGEMQKSHKYVYCIYTKKPGVKPVNIASIHAEETNTFQVDSFDGSHRQMHPSTMTPFFETFLSCESFDNDHGINVPQSIYFVKEMMKKLALFKHSEHSFLLYGSCMQ